MLIDKVLDTYSGDIKINDKSISKSQLTTLNLKNCKGMNILLIPNQTLQNEPKKEQFKGDSVGKELQITVKQYMTQKASPDFDFMEKWNNDNPMPLRVMRGRVLQETPGMYKMELHGDIIGEQVCTCMRCGRAITNPWSIYFGVGNECFKKLGMVVPDYLDEDIIQREVGKQRKALRDITWTGWVIKSSITEKKEVDIVG